MGLVPTEIVKAERKNPHFTLMFGPTKVGKTGILSQLKGCLIIDTENGTMYIDALKVKVNSYAELVEVIKELKRDKRTFKYLALDVIDQVIEWAGDFVKQKYMITDLGADFAFGYTERNKKIVNVLKQLKGLTEHLIIVGHEDVKDASDLTDSWERKSIDIGGKLGRLIAADADAICRVYRKRIGDGDEEALHLSFKPSESMNVGSRCDHLRGKVFKFTSWDEIFLPN